MNTTQNEKVRCLIIGSGPAGYTAAIYASRANLSPVLYEGIQPGGQLTTTTEVENFPGYPEGVTGTELMEDLRKQAARFGADIRVGIATETDLSAAPYKVTIDGEKVIETETLIISTGATAKYLGLPDEQKYAGMGVSACATCDGFFYRKKVVAVVGGGDTACEEALYLSSLAKQVYLIVRKPYLRASKVMQERVLNTPNITVLFEHNTIGLFGEDGVEGAHLVKRMGEPDEEKVDIAIDGFFLVAMAADTVSRMRRTATSGCSVRAPAPVPSFMGTVAIFGFISFIHSHSPRSPHTQYTGTPRELATSELSISSGASMPFTLTKLFWVFMVWESGLPGICAAL